MTQTDSELDLRPLTAPIERRRLRAFIDQVKTPETMRTGLATSFWTLAAVVLIVQVSAAVAFLSHGDPVPIAIIVIGPILIGGFGIVQLLRWLSRRTPWRSRYRIAGFAAANGMVYIDSIPNPELPGMIFSIGQHRLSTAVVGSATPRPFSLGNHRYVLDSDDERSRSVRARMHRWGFVVIRLDAPLPHIVLDARRNDSTFRSNLPVDLSRSQRLSLEGDVDRHFTLYCPTGYEADALYLFSPDVLAHLIDEAGDLDVEIIDDQLFLYSANDISTDDPQRWERMLRLVAVLQTKLDQWGRWRDGRFAEGQDAAPQHGVRQPDTMPVGATPIGVAPMGVARPGRRLRTAFPWVATVFGLLYLAFGVFMSINR